jgi:hypothetical protein
MTTPRQLARSMVRHELLEAVMPLPWETCDFCQSNSGRYVLTKPCCTLRLTAQQPPRVVNELLDAFRVQHGEEAALEYQAELQLEFDRVQALRRRRSTDQCPVE